MGIGPIAPSKIRAFVREEVGLDGDAHEQFCEVIMRVDDDYVSMCNAPKEEKDQMRSIVSPNDPKAVGGLMDRLAKPKKQSPKKKRGT